MSYCYKIISAVVILILSLFLIHYSNLDIKFQSLFFSSNTKLWLVDRDDVLLKFIFYKLPKYLIISYGVTAILYLVKLRVEKHDVLLQKTLLFLILALIFIPVIVATLKHYSPIYCPNVVEHFGGERIYISPFNIFADGIFLSHFGKCFPAGHASGGFALISLYFVIQQRSIKITALLFSLMLGCVMGGYQIAKGAHYLSDTITTLVISYLVCITLEQIIQPLKKS